MSYTELYGDLSPSPLTHGEVLDLIERYLDACTGPYRDEPPPWDPDGVEWQVLMDLYHQVVGVPYELDFGPDADDPWSLCGDF